MLGRVFDEDREDGAGDRGAFGDGEQQVRGPFDAVAPLGCL